MKAKDYEISANRIARDIKIKVILTGKKRFYFRFFLFKVLLNLAVFISPFGGIEIITREKAVNDGKH